MKTKNSTKKKDHILKYVGNQTVLVPIDFHCMDIYIVVIRWLNDDSLLIFGWTIPFSSMLYMLYQIKMNYI